MFYQYCPPSITVDSIKEDLKVLPKGKTLQDKYYIGFYKDGFLIAVMDLINGYPDTEIAFIVFFMIDQQMQGKGIGTAIITEACQYFKEVGFFNVRLGYVKGNHQSEAFWLKNHFVRAGIEKQAEGYIIVVMKRSL